PYAVFLYSSGFCTASQNDSAAKSPAPWLKVQAGRQPKGPGRDDRPLGVPSACREGRGAAIAILGLEAGDSSTWHRHVTSHAREHLQHGSTPLFNSTPAIPLTIRLLATRKLKLMPMPPPPTEPSFFCRE
ncbi:hypothetical protein ILYODFUR_035414, partial [Ilyodon furcidens]